MTHLVKVLSQKLPQLSQCCDCCQKLSILANLVAVLEAVFCRLCWSPEGYQCLWGIASRQCHILCVCVCVWCHPFPTQCIHKVQRLCGNTEWTLYQTEMIWLNVLVYKIICLILQWGVLRFPYSKAVSPFVDVHGGQIQLLMNNDRSQKDPYAWKMITQNCWPVIVSLIVCVVAPSPYRTDL